MKQSNKVITAAVGIAAAAGLAITGASLASADTPVQAATSGTYDGVMPEGGASGGMAGGGQGQDPSRSMHPGETLLTGTAKDKVIAAAKAKEPGATIERVETDAEGVYEAHMVRAGGTPIIVQVDRTFAVTAVRTGGPGGGRHGGPGAGPEARTGQQPQPDQSGESGQLGGSATGEGASST
jgi:ABC-type glycerol-3-phosphate transport system substrate-binding protein